MLKTALKQYKTGSADILFRGVVGHIRSSPIVNRPFILQVGFHLLEVFGHTGVLAGTRLLLLEASVPAKRHRHGEFAIDHQCAVNAKRGKQARKQKSNYRKV